MRRGPSCSRERSILTRGLGMGAKGQALPLPIMAGLGTYTMFPFWAQGTNWLVVISSREISFALVSRPIQKGRSATFFVELRCPKVPGRSWHGCQPRWLPGGTIVPNWADYEYGRACPLFPPSWRTNTTFTWPSGVPIYVNHES